MRTRTTWVGGAIIALALAGGAGRFAVAAQTHEHDTTPAAPAVGRDDMRMHAEMMSAMHAREARLASLVKTMDGATGDAKVETMATIIRELVQAEKQMHATMEDVMRPARSGPAERTP